MAGLVLVVGAHFAWGQAASWTEAEQTQTSGGHIRGVVKSGNTPIPGATVVISVAGSTASPASGAASNSTPAGSDVSSSGKITSTDVDGSYSLAVPAYGSYTVRVQMVAFAVGTQTVVVDAAHANVVANFEMSLLSRTRAENSRTQTAGARPGEGARQGRREGAGGAGSRGFQSLSTLENLGSGEGGGNALSDVVPSGMPVPGIDPNGATESIAVSGNSSNSLNSMSGDELRERINEARASGAGFGGGSGSGFGGGGFGGGFAGGFGGGGGRGRRGFDMNHPHGSIYYGLGDSALNAAPYALAGEPAVNPSYVRHSFGGSVGGPLNIPHVYKGGNKTFYFVNYNGRRGENPFDQFSIVPTLLERQGNFSALCRTGFTAGVCNDRDASGNVIDQIYDPATGLPIANNTLTSINSIAGGLLQYIPMPNITPAPGNFQNFHFVTATTSSSDDLNVRVNHALGGASAGPRGGRGARNNLTFGFHYHASRANLTNPFPSVGGATSVRNIDVPLGYIRTFGKLTNNLRFDFNRSRTHAQNLYAFNDNIDGGLGIGGVSENPFDWGLPSLTFTNSASLQDVNPQLLRNQTYTISDSMVWNHGKHTLRWGGDFRFVQRNTEASSNARGAFTFTGANTAAYQTMDGQKVAIQGTGLDFADFLLGLPQLTAVQFGQDNYYFRGHYWDLYAQDEWKVRGNLTLNLGVRYEYLSPYTELHNQIANLDLSPGVLNPAAGTPSVAVVTAGQSGPYSGTLPASLVRPDRNNLAPRIGFAWKPLRDTVVRGGYGINYNTGAYSTIAQQLAFQPPFSTASTNIQTAEQAGAGYLTLANGFPAAAGITNNYAVDPNYRLGYVQIRNLDIQQQIRPTLVLNLDYTGTKGTKLDILEAPNRTTGPGGFQTLIAGAQPFTFESSAGDAEANALSVRVRKRLASGFSIGGIYTWSKAIDDASSIGAGATVGSGGGGLGAGGTGAGTGGASASPGSGANSVAQNPLDLSAERGLSSFDQTHRFTADYLIELPFGHDKRFLGANTPWRAIFGDWQLSGDWTIASGLPFTPRFVGNVGEVNAGTTGTLRPDVVPGQQVQLGNPSIAEWFNTAAFVAPPGGQYGNARRNSIIGPPTHVFDMGFTKIVPLKEARVLEFRVQGTNIFNIPNYAAIDTSVTSPTFGRVTGVGGMRQLTITARFRF